MLAVLAVVVLEFPDIDDCFVLCLLVDCILFNGLFSFQFSVSGKYRYKNRNSKIEMEVIKPNAYFSIH